ELEEERAFATMAKKNVSPLDVPFFLGAGACRHHIPATVDHQIQRSELRTSYTPSQRRISQGTVQNRFQCQTQVSMIIGMQVADASMYDGATAADEAVLMAQRVTKKGKAELSGGLHPHYHNTIATLMDQTDQPHVEAPTDLNGSED